MWWSRLLLSVRRRGGTESRRAAHQPRWRAMEALEPRALFETSPLQFAAFNPLGGDPTVLVGPGGAGDADGAALLDLNHDGTGDMIIQYPAKTHGGAVSSIRVSALLVSPDGQSREFRIAEYGSNVSIAQTLTADLNSDGELDVVVLHDDGAFGQKHRLIDVYLGHADGTFTHPGAAIDLGTTAGFPVMTLFDMNGDGRTDIHLREAATFTVYRGNNNGTFQSAAVTTFPFLTLSGVNNVAFMNDLSGDGIPDMVVSGNNALAQLVLLVVKGQADGKYNLTPTFNDSTNNLTLLSLEQLTSDDKLDIVAYSTAPFTLGQPASVFVFKNDGVGGYTESFHSSEYAGGLLHQLSGGEPLQPLVATDVDNDGDTDMILLEGSILSSDIKIHVARNNGNAGFIDVLPVSASHFASTSSIEVTDIDGDTFPDVFITQLNSGTMATIFFNNGAGALTSPGLTLAPDLTTSDFPRLADFTGDGRKDVVFVGIPQGLSSSTQVLVNDATGRAFTGSGFTQAATLHLTETNGVPADALLDYTGDGVPDILNFRSNPTADVALGFGVLASDLDGTFTEAMPIVAFGQSVTVRQIAHAGDFNHDNKIDLAFSSKTGFSQDTAGIYVVVNGVTPLEDTAGSDIGSALDLGTLVDNLSFDEFVEAALGGGGNDSQDFYRFTLTEATTIRLRANPSVGAINLTLRDENGFAFASSTLPGIVPQVITRDLEAGDYHFSVAKGGGASTLYRVDIALTPDDAEQLAVFDGLDPRTSGAGTVDFGDVLLTTTDTRHTFTVLNQGSTTINLGAIQLPAGFSLADDLLTTLLIPGQSDTFSVRMNTDTPGTFSGDIVIPSDAANGNFVIPVTGIVEDAPVMMNTGQITVLLNGVVIPPTNAGTIDFGTFNQGDAAPTRVFTVRNDGDGALSLSAPQLPAGYTLVEPLSSSLGIGQSDTFTVRMNTAAVGTFAGNIVIGNDSGGTSSDFNIPVTGVVNAVQIVRPDENGEITDVVFNKHSVTLSDVLIPGDTLEVDLRLFSVGLVSLPAGTQAVTFYASTDLFLNEGVDTPLATVSAKTKALVGGDHADFTYKIKLPTDIAAGNYFIIADLDSGDAIDEANESNNVALSGRIVPVVLAAGQVGDRKNVKLTLTEADGTVATIALSGGGTVNAAIDPDTGAIDLDITGATSKSSLSIKTKPTVKGGDNTILLRDVTVNSGSPGSGIGKLDAATAMLMGTFDSPGGAASLKLLGADSAAINVGTPAGVAKPALTLTFGQVANTSVTSDIAIKALSAIEWLDDDGTPDVITAPAISALKTTGAKKPTVVAGDFQADITGPDDGGAVLGSAKIAGSLTGATLNLSGATGALAINGDAGAADAPVTITADTIKSIAIKGSASSLAIDLMQPFDPAKPKLSNLSTLSIKGTADMLTLTSLGNVGSVTTGALSASSILVGLAPNVVGLPNSPDDFAPGVSAVLSKLVVTGGFASTNVAASSILSATLPDPAAENGGVPFGLAANVLKSVKIGSVKEPDADKSKSVDSLTIAPDFELRSFT